MRIVLLTLSCGLAACSSSPISQYCASLATCSMEDCELSPEACEELRQGDQDACEAELKATRDVIATGGGAACTTCVEVMDRYHTCAADIPTCTDFANAQTEDCDGEYQEYMEACTPQVQEACGQKTTTDTLMDTLTSIWTSLTGTTGDSRPGVDTGFDHSTSECWVTPPLDGEVALEFDKIQDCSLCPSDWECMTYENMNDTKCFLPCRDQTDCDECAPDTQCEATTIGMQLLEVMLCKT